MLDNLRSVVLSKSISRAIRSDSPRNYRNFFFVLLAIVTLLCLLMIGVGMAPIRTMPWDVMINLDNAWRVYQGQIPHTDYFNPLAPFYSVLTALGMKITSPSASALVYGNVIACAILTPWAWWIARQRFSAPIAFFFTLMIALLLIAPRPLGLSPRMTGYAMIYNRQGFVFLGMLLIQLFIPSRESSSRRSQFLSGLSSGTLLALTLFCKLNYFGAALLAVLLFLPIFRPSLRWAGGFVGGFALFFLGVKVLLGINLPDLLADARTAGKLVSVPSRLKKLNKIIAANALTVAIVFGTAFPVLYLTTTGSFKNLVKNFFRDYLPPLFTIAISFPLTAGNAQELDIPTFFIAGLMILDRIGRSGDGAKPNFRIGKIIFPVLLFALLYFPIVLNDIQSIAYSAIWHRTKLASVPESQKFASPRLADFIVPEFAESIPKYEGFDTRAYINKVNDGLALIQKNTREEKRILSLDGINPFPFALGWKSPTGDAAWWWRKYSFSRELHPNPERVFGNTDIVMIPKRGEQTRFDLLYIYEKYVGKHFSRKDESRDWTLWVKRSID